VAGFAKDGLTEAQRRSMVALWDELKGRYPRVIPLGHGPEGPIGSDEPANLQSLCAHYHRVKSATRDRRWGTHVAEPRPPDDAAIEAWVAQHGWSCPGLAS
jgi:hypothetical protein